MHMDRTEWPTGANYTAEELSEKYGELKRKLFDLRLAIEQGTSFKRKRKTS